MFLDFHVSEVFMSGDLEGHEFCNKLCRMDSFYIGT